MVRKALSETWRSNASHGHETGENRGYFSPDETVLFWYTGGIPALFAEPYASALLGS